MTDYASLYTETYKTNVLGIEPVIGVIPSPHVFAKGKHVTRMQKLMDTKSTRNVAKVAKDLDLSKREISIAAKNGALHKKTDNLFKEIVYDKPKADSLARHKNFRDHFVKIRRKEQRYDLGFIVNASLIQGVARYKIYNHERDRLQDRHEESYQEALSLIRVQ